jgi:hypothetical protein
VTEPRKRTVTELASEYKARGYADYYAWDRYIADTGLKPEVDANEFYRIFKNVSAADLGPKLPQGWAATHIDTLVNRQVQIKYEHGVYSMVWDNGVIGSDPEALHPADRYVEVANE